MENLTLAPAAGAGIGKLIAENLLARPGFIEAMSDVIEGAIHATARHWDREKREFVIEPDWKTRLAAFFGAMAHMEGEPIKRILHQHMGPAGIDPLAALENPAVREAMQAQLDKFNFRSTPGERSKAKAKERREKRAEPVQDGKPAGGF